MPLPELLVVSRPVRHGPQRPGVEPVVAFAADSFLGDQARRTQDPQMLGHGRAQLKQLITNNIEAEKPQLAVDDLAGMVMTFFAGLSVEQNLKSSRASVGRKVDNLMQVLRRL